MRICMMILGAAALVTSGANAAQTPAKTMTTPGKMGPGKMVGSELAPMAKVSLAQARATALKARGGTITDQELEKERGGTGLRYSFDIKSGAKTYEVGVDAKTGKVLENKAEGKNPD